MNIFKLNFIYNILNYKININIFDFKLKILIFVFILIVIVFELFFYFVIEFFLNGFIVFFLFKILFGVFFYVKDLFLRCGNYQLVVWWVLFFVYNMLVFNDVSILGYMIYLLFVNIDKVVFVQYLVFIVIFDFNKNYRFYLMIVR